MQHRDILSAPKWMRSKLKKEAAAKHNAAYDQYKFNLSCIVDENPDVTGTAEQNALALFHKTILRTGN